MNSVDENIKSPLSKLNQTMSDKFQKNLVYVLATYTLLFFLTLICMVYQNHNTGLAAGATDKRSITILTQINSLQGQLQKIDFNQNSKSLKATVSSLSNQLADIEKTLTENAKNTEIEKINQHLTTLETDISELGNTISAQFNQKKYLNEKILPFQVSYLDMISGQPFVSVNYQHHITPLGIGDQLNGWTMTAADYAAQTVEFANGQGQYIKMALGG
jgi:hypothetical protein